MSRTSCWCNILEIPKGERRRNGKAALEKAKRGVDCLESDAMSLIWLNDCLTAYDYFSTMQTTSIAISKANSTEIF